MKSAASIGMLFVLFLAGCKKQVSQSDVELLNNCLTADESGACVELGLEAASPEDPGFSRSLVLYALGCERDNPVACSYLAKILERPQTDFTNETLAGKLLEKACRLDYQPACREDALRDGGARAKLADRLRPVERRIPADIIKGCLGRISAEFGLRYALFMKSFEWLDRPITYDALEIRHQVYESPVEDLYLLVWTARARIQLDKPCRWQAATLGSIHKGIYRLWFVTSSCIDRGGFGLEGFEESEDEFKVTGAGWKWSMKKDSILEEKEHLFMEKELKK